MGVSIEVRPLRAGNHGDIAADLARRAAKLGVVVFRDFADVRIIARPEPSATQERR